MIWILPEGRQAEYADLHKATATQAGKVSAIPQSKSRGHWRSEVSGIEVTGKQKLP
jgi:hypothetical protein